MEDLKALSEHHPHHCRDGLGAGRTAVLCLGSMPLIFVVSVKKQQPEPSVCQLRALQNVLAILNTQSL